jgi:predicted type IV restriction endonuclease
MSGGHFDYNQHRIGYIAEEIRDQIERNGRPKTREEMKDEEAIIRGRIEVLVIKNQLWLLVIESKRSDFAVTRAIPQALAYMLSNSETVQPTFGMITNGNEFLFLKTSQNEYANSRLFSLVNPNNELYEVLQVLKYLGSKICL